MVSVVVVTYQHAAFIEECVQGILIQQTTFPVEILIGEDESTDGTREICQRYAAEFPDRIRLFLRSRKDVMYIDGNATGRANLLALLSKARGKYIALCEGDDYWTDPLKLQKQVDFLEAHPDYSMCFHQAMLLKGGMEVPILVPEAVDLDNVQFEDLLATTNFIATASVVFRNELKPLPAWFPKLPFGDLGMYFLNSRKGKIKCLDEFMSVYRIHEGGVWTGRSRTVQLKGWLRFFSILWKYLTPAERAIAVQRRNSALDHFAYERYPRNPRRMRLYRQYLGCFRYHLGRY
ncbi:MAG: glycosyltransferase [Flavobacteriales bacterium]